jgi:hypothetical protein
MAPGKYDRFFTPTRFIKGPQGHPKPVYFSSDRGGDINFGMLWNYVTAPFRMPDDPHWHPFDEVWLFLGGDQSNTKDFDAEIEVYLGEEGEKHVITSPTVLEIPRGTVHCPLIFTKVNKPIVFVNLPLTPKYVKDDKKK